MASYLHRHHPCTNRPITNATGPSAKSAIYKPFGEQTEFVQPGLTAPESKGWIGQRYDADAGLQYLNARYYDPVLGMFLQPDWWEVLQPGVGTNRFSYSFNDPVNLSDPNGNCVWDACITEATLTYALGAAIVAYIITDTADNGVPDGSLLITTIENFDVGQEGFTPTPSEPTVLSSPIDEGPSITVEGMSSEVESGPIVLADPIQDDFFGNTVYAGQTGSYEIYVNDPEGKQFVYVGKGPDERMRASMRRLDGQGFEVIDKLWEAAPSPREAFKDEDRRIESLSGGDGVGSGYLLNERNSPGKRYREEDDD